ncbi:MAG: hypothetical protein ACRELG_30645 [Gemmataceae bacterium]
MPAEKRELIPQPFQGEVQVTLVLPNEALRLLNDLHQDRQGIAAGGILFLACVVALCFKHVFGREKA